MKTLTGQSFAQIGDDAGGAYADGGHLGYGRTIRGISGRAAEFAQGKPARVAITHADSPESAAYLLQQLRRRFGPQQDIPMMKSGAVLATHTGLGAVARMGCSPGTCAHGSLGRGRVPREERYVICFLRQTGGGWCGPISRVVRPAATLDRAWAGFACL